MYILIRWKKCFRIFMQLVTFYTELTPLYFQDISKLKETIHQQTLFNEIHDNRMETFSSTKIVVWLNGYLLCMLQTLLVRWRSWKFSNMFLDSADRHIFTHSVVLYLSRIKRDFFLLYVTMDEIWIHQYATASVFRDTDGKIFID